MKTKLYGWYNGSPKAEGNVVLSYWNKIVNDYPSVGEDGNDPRRYSKEHYVEAVKRFMNDHLKKNPNRRFIIDLPVAEVWWAGTRIAEDGFEEVIPEWKTLEWIKYVVDELNSNSNIIGWYHTDEPEVWGYREVVNGNPISNAPIIPYYFLKQRYDLIKSISSKPVIAVFCDVSLFYKRYYNDIKKYGAFFSVFGFDHYPYLIRGNDGSLNKIKQFINIATEIDPLIPVMFVGQGSGSEEFNTRVPNLKEHQELYTTFTKYCPSSRRFAYLLWAYDYGTIQATRLGDIVLHCRNNECLLNTWDWENFTLKQEVTYYLKKYLPFIKKLLKLK
jgi:hypothetical protein